MNSQPGQKPSFWGTVRLLLRGASKRAEGRRLRQQQLLQNRSDGKGTDWSGLGFMALVCFTLFLQCSAAFVLDVAVKTAQRVEVEQEGKIVVSDEFFNGIYEIENTPEIVREVRPGLRDTPDYSGEARRISERYGGSRDAIEARLRRAVASSGSMELLRRDIACPGLSGVGKNGPLVQELGSLFLLWWVVMMIFQGEGLEVDTQRRRHPVWEWLFSHPVQPGAVFLAEMLAPIAANPTYWFAPAFSAVAYGMVYGPGWGLLAAVLVGIPVTLAAACLGKALEVGVMLRLAPRSRGATIGLMSWLGYTAIMMFLVGLFFVPRFITATAGFFQLLAAVPWPWLNWFLGIRGDGSSSFPVGVLSCWATAGLVIFLAVLFSVWGAKRGLSGNFASDAPGPSAAEKPARFGKDPLYRKEMLWFIRDRSAIVQTLLVPLTVAGYQIFNLRGILVHAQSAWNYLCGVAIFFGTYFLWVLGPKSLQSEGTALWIALTWPRGLESLLKAKAWLWSLISTGLVAIVLGYAAYSFRADTLKIALVGVGWFVFAQSMAEKSVTLVTLTSESGETQTVPTGRRWAAQLGMLTFAIGIVTGQWQLAVIGIVYSYLTAAAMWQNFRARLPYLYDPWSERVPPAPTLMHAMVSISILVELAALLSAIIFAAGGPETAAVGQALAYGVSATVVSLLVANFLHDRNVGFKEVWCWLPSAETTDEVEPRIRRFWLGVRGNLPGSMLGAGGGLALGCFAQGYLAVLRHLPVTGEMIRKSQEQANSIPEFHLWYGIMAIGFAPFAEEYLFRGLLFRALDREWGGWRAVLGSAAFFAIYHPPLAWLPVGMLGAANCLVFKKTGRLMPAVLLHLVYNAVVLL